MWVLSFVNRLAFVENLRPLLHAIQLILGFSFRKAESDLSLDLSHGIDCAPDGHWGSLLPMWGFLEVWLVATNIRVFFTFVLLYLRNLARLSSGLRLRRPRRTYADPTQLYLAYPDLTDVPVGYLRLQLRNMSHEFISFPIDPTQILPWESAPSMPIHLLRTQPTHIFAIPIFVSGRLTKFLSFPIHDIVFMIMCPKLKRLPRIGAGNLPHSNSIDIPVVLYRVPAPHSFALFQEHIYMMDYDLLLERFMGIRTADLELDRDSFLAQMSTEYVLAQATLLLRSVGLIYVVPVAFRPVQRLDFPDY
ncbi:hypothetical protein CVT25_013444 [Psilocybe cyanescens]|uniref:Uncharacterized protein n=1 Tax=Psilocybe cyanescens TaxID=93625 RepID=A0A409WT61_PSICY|nr:hypothetical protein CVT25_013444 [Psilocybe cyanescens]